MQLRTVLSIRPGTGGMRFVATVPTLSLAAARRGLLVLQLGKAKALVSTQQATKGRGVRLSHAITCSHEAAATKATLSWATPGRRRLCQNIAVSAPITLMRLSFTSR